MQRRKPLFWQIYPFYLWMTLVPLALIMVYTAFSFKEFYHDQMAAGLESRAQIVGVQVKEFLAQGRRAEIQRYVKEWGERSQTRITVILLSGEVVGDSRGNPAQMDNHAQRPELLALATGRVARSVRHSDTVGEDLMYVAIPLENVAGERIGIVRTAIAVDGIYQALSSLFAKVAVAALAVAALVAMVSWLFSKHLTQPLEAIRARAERIAQGDFTGRVQLGASDAQEIHSLGLAINEMAVQMSNRLNIILEQKREQEAVLSSMVEGVIAVDKNENIMNINQAALDLLGLDSGALQGRAVQEVIRIPELQRFIQRALKSRGKIEDEVVLGEKLDQYWQVNGGALRGADGEELGALVVFADVSRMRQLENHRRDFVANVSHELRTPLTSIKGFLETLLDGALENPAEARRFVEIAQKQADRLNAIIEDLLMLSRLEKEVEGSEVLLEAGPVRRVMEDAIQLCELQAKEKGLRLELDCSPNLQALMNAPLLEQALVNLIDNAIKYSDPGKTIEVGGRRVGKKVVLHIKDEGYGIPQEHLPRIFERFYRVDKARSRKQGGTGLGLSIVKHVAAAHRGVAKVESVMGQGSVFALHLLAAQ